jgi:erythromycin esterase-like protein
MKDTIRWILPAALLCATWMSSSVMADEKPLAWLDETASPLDDTTSLDTLVAAMRERRLVMLGESTHGTHEFYKWRDRITRRLVADAGFRFILVEGDWASLHELNRHVKDLPGAAATARDALAAQQRWPQWLWANEETIALAEWLREWNNRQPSENRVGFHGMDVYAPWRSIDMVVTFSTAHLPDAAPRIARKLAPMRGHPDDIGAYVRGHHPRRAEVLAGYHAALELVRDARDVDGVHPSEWFAAIQAAHVIIGAHRHFMGMAEDGPQSWNHRAEHMHQTAQRLLDRHGEGARGIVWAHNTHIGDARATAMSARGEVNIGHLARESLGRDEVFALGFATHRGRVIAGRVWDGPREEMVVPHGAPGSLEALLNERFPDGALLRTGDAPDRARADSIPHRAIGVIYQPDNETGNYVATRPAERYDALIFIPETRPLTAFDDGR